VALATQARDEYVKLGARDADEVSSWLKAHPVP
jgi:hypothetical protein